MDSINGIQGMQINKKPIRMAISKLTPLLKSHWLLLAPMEMRKSSFYHIFLKSQDMYNPKVSILEVRN
jgi:hypothetical protein